MNGVSIKIVRRVFAVIVFMLAVVAFILAVEKGGFQPFGMVVVFVMVGAFLLRKNSSPKE